MYTKYRMLSINYLDFCVNLTFKKGKEMCGMLFLIFLFVWQGYTNHLTEDLMW
jgi:hypothetical protein